MDALDFLITLLNPSTKTVLNNIFDIQNKNNIEREIPIRREKKTPTVTFNDKIEENIFYNDSYDSYEIYDNNNSSDGIKEQKSLKEDNEYKDLLPLTPIPEKRVNKYGKYDSLNIESIHDKEALKKLKKEVTIYFIIYKKLYKNFLIYFK